MSYQKDLDRHNKLVEEAKEAINKVFTDTKVPTSQTRASLSEIINHAETSMDSLGEEIDE